MAKQIDLIGQRHGRLVCVDYLGLKERADGRRNRMWRCICDCGNEKVVSTNQFGIIRSCGCLTGDVAHDRLYKGRNKRLYSVLLRMKDRCYDPVSPYYHNYGGRGIKVCEEWLGDNGIDNFEKWALSHGYTEGLTIERINNNADYSPDNCKWATMKEQSNNKRNNVRIEIDGKSQTLTQWCEQYDVPYSRVRVRVQKMGWSLEEALTTPKYRKRG